MPGERSHSTWRSTVTKQNQSIPTTGRNRRITFDMGLKSFTIVLEHFICVRTDFNPNEYPLTDDSMGVVMSILEADSGLGDPFNPSLIPA